VRSLLVDQEVLRALIAPATSVFHAALVGFAAIQIHETKVALVRTPDCDGSVSFVVCPTSKYFHAQALIVLFSQDLRWQWHLVQQGGTFTHRRPSYHCGIMDHHSFFRAGTILRIRVSN
jgi:hypothetical protein